MDIRFKDIEAVDTEYKKAVAKFPVWPSDLLYAAAIVAEESGELIRAAVQLKMEGGNKEELRKETIQTAAMCFRLLANLD